VITESKPLADAAAAAVPRRQRPEPRRWKVSVVSKQSLNPRMTRLRLAGDDLNEFEWKRGQDVILHLQDRGEPVRRHYTIRHHDAAAKIVDIDFVLHGDSPAGRFVQNAAPGDTLEIAGPRGRTVVNPSADWHLFLGDETCIPAIFAILEDLPRGANATAFIEIGTEADKQTLNAKADVTLEWVMRNGAKAGPSDLLLRRLEDFTFPAGCGHAYVIGETSNVRAQRHRLLERGFTKEQIAAEGYWRPDRVGGHDHI